jgi:predicted amidohydrolase
MLVDPWGMVMEQIPQGSAVAVADIDKALLDSIRRNFPVINHRRIDGTSA